MAVRRTLDESTRSGALAGRHQHSHHHGRSRRDFLRGVGLGGAGLAAWATLDSAGTATAQRGRPGGTARPVPIAGDPALAPFSVFLPSAPSAGIEPSVITDFKGDIGLCQVQGTGAGSDGNTWHFDADMRFMQGGYLTTDGVRRNGTFGFV